MKLKKAIVILYISLLLLMLLYPPHYTEIEGRKVSREHYFLLSSPSPLLHPDGTKLAINILVLSVVFGLGYYGVKMGARS